MFSSYSGTELVSNMLQHCFFYLAVNFVCVCYHLLERMYAMAPSVVLPPLLPAPSVDGGFGGWSAAVIVDSSISLRADCTPLARWSAAKSHALGIMHARSCCFSSSLRRVTWRRVAHSTLSLSSS